jgi:hypothetical protein
MHPKCQDAPHDGTIAGRCRRTGIRPAVFCLMWVFGLAGLLAYGPADIGVGRNQSALSPLVEDWLGGGDRSDFPWKVRLLPARLTFQQRHLVEVQVIIRSEDLQVSDKERELFATLAVSDESGRWLREAESITLEIPANLSKSQEILFSEAIYLRPGSYIIAVMVGDGVFRKVNVRRLPVRVSPLKNDPLSDRDLRLPAVEFAPDVPDAPPGVLRFAGKAWPMAPEPLPLPVETGRPLAIDLVLNTAVSFGFVSGRGSVTGTASSYPILTGAVLQAGNFLSQMDLKSGCVRTSVVNVRRMEKIADRQESRRLNWEELQAPLWQRGSHTIDVGTLQNRNRQSAFLHEVLDGIMSDADPCSRGAGKSEHVVVFISQDLQFPAETVMMPLRSAAGRDCRLFYFQLNVGFVSGGDTIRDMLKALRPRVLRFDSPNSFRQAVARFLAEIAKQL